MIGIIILGSLVGARSYEITDYINVLSVDNKSIDDTTGIVKIKYYSDSLERYFEHNFEGTKRFDDCKTFGSNISFDCSSYTDYEDYLQKKMSENELANTVQTIQISNESSLWVEIFDLRARIEALESLLNITYTEPKDSLPIYECVEDGDLEECPGGLSGGLGTRCYFTQLKMATGWNYCAGGWILE